MAIPVEGNMACKAMQTRTSIRSFCWPAVIITTGSLSSRRFTQWGGVAGMSHEVVLTRSSWIFMLSLQFGKMIVRAQISRLSSALVTFV